MNGFDDIVILKKNAHVLEAYLLQEDLDFSWTLDYFLRISYYHYQIRLIIKRHSQCFAEVKVVL